jgi:carbon starvation protein
MNAMPFVIGAIVIFALAYRFYFAFVAAKVAVQNDLAVTPAHRLYDGQNYYPMNKWVLFGHHFAAIAGAGPLVGPVLAAQFGFFPGFMWMLVGAVMAGAVHDFVILTASVQHDGRSLAEIARKEINKVSGITTSVAIIIIIIVALAGLGLVVVNALAESSWGTFTIASTIPIALIEKGKRLRLPFSGLLCLFLQWFSDAIFPARSLPVGSLSITKPLPY